jgi:hypothetical protein
MDKELGVIKDLKVRVKFTGRDKYSGQRIKFMGTLYCDRDMFVSRELEMLRGSIYPVYSDLYQVNDWVSDYVHSDRIEGLKDTNMIGAILDYELYSVDDLIPYGLGMLHGNRISMCNSILKWVCDREGFDFDLLEVRYSSMYHQLRTYSTLRQVKIVLDLMGYDVSYLRRLV